MFTLSFAVQHLYVYVSSLVGYQGVLARLVLAVLAIVAARSVKDLFKTATNLLTVAVEWTQLTLSFVANNAVTFRELALALLQWKTYKKSGTWRDRTARRDNGAEIEPCSHDDSNSKSTPDWFGTEEDVEFFNERIIDGGEGGKWRCICQNELDGYLKYAAYFRLLPGNKTEYKSVTYVKDATAEEMTRFYLDDPCRRRWDSMLASAEQLEAGSIKNRCEVVRWVRTFPFPFLSDREYIIGRRIFRKENGTIYTVSRGIEHAAAPLTPSMVRMDVFYSMWSCRNVECPWGTGKTACEVVLLHHEQFKIPERFARLAACNGMWGFIKSMGPAIARFVQNDRCSTSGSSSSSTTAATDRTRTTSTTGASATRQEKSNRLRRTARRALIAAAVTTAVVFTRKYNRRRSP